MDYMPVGRPVKITTCFWYFSQAKLRGLIRLIHDGPVASQAHLDGLVELYLRPWSPSLSQTRMLDPSNWLPDFSGGHQSRCKLYSRIPRCLALLGKLRVPANAMRGPLVGTSARGDNGRLQVY
jgi:hypothetical protein